MNKINFKKWAFHFTIWIVLINIITFYLTVNYTNLFFIKDNTPDVITKLGIIATILLVLSLIFIILSSVKKEKKNYQYWIALLGILIFGVLPITMFYF